MSHEVRELGGFPKTEHTPNPEMEDKSLDELTELISWPHKFEENMAKARRAAGQTPQASEPEPVEEPIPEQVETEEADEPTPETATEPEAEPVTETVEEEPTETSQEDLEAEILKARFEALEAHTKKMEASMAARKSGEYGHIKQLKARIKELEAAAQPRSELDDADSYQEPTRESRRPAPPVQEPSGLTTWAIQNAVSQAAQNFAAGRPDQGELQEEMREYLASSGYDAQSVLTTNDPIEAGRETTRILEEAYWHAKAARKSSRVSELEKRRADQTPKLEEAKKKAAISGSGSVPPAPKQQTAIEDLSLEELEKKMKALQR